MLFCMSDNSSQSVMLAGLSSSALWPLLQCMDVCIIAESIYTQTDARAPSKGPVRKCCSEWSRKCFRRSCHVRRPYGVCVRVRACAFWPTRHTRPPSPILSPHMDQPLCDQPATEFRDVKTDRCLSLARTVLTHAQRVTDRSSPSFWQSYALGQSVRNWIHGFIKLLSKSCACVRATLVAKSQSDLHHAAKIIAGFDRAGLDPFPVTVHNPHTHTAEEDFQQCNSGSCINTPHSSALATTPHDHMLMSHGNLCSVFVHTKDAQLNGSQQPEHPRL